MTIAINTAIDVLYGLTSEAKSVYPSIQILPIPFIPAERQKALLDIKQTIRNTPYERFAHTIIQREFGRANAAPSLFLGMAIERRRTLFGLRKREHMTALCTFNLDLIENENALTFAFWHGLSHALDCAAIRHTSKHAKNFTEGPMIPKRPAQNMARTNLKADMFAALVLSHNGHSELCERLIQEKAMAVLVAQADARPELSILPIAAEQIRFALQTSENSSNAAGTLRLCRNLSEDILSAFDKTSIDGWFTLCRNAQEMAWLGYQPGEILSAAANNSDVPLIRNLAGELADILGLLPLRDFPVNRHYNPFMSVAANRKIHENLCAHSFHNQMEAAIIAENADPLRHEAIMQSRAILDGHGIGWCAHALLAAADLFDEHYFKGANEQKLTQTLTIGFKNAQSLTSWEDIRRFCGQIVKTRSKGRSSHWQQESENAIKDPGLSCIGSAIKTCASISPDDFQGQLPAAPPATSPLGRAGIEERTHRIVTQAQPPKTDKTRAKPA